jgi:hypothetical protein
VDPHGARAEIDRFMREIEENEGTLREIAEIAASNELDLDGLDLEPAPADPRHHAAAQ